MILHSFKAAQKTHTCMFEYTELIISIILMFQCVIRIQQNTVNPVVKEKQFSLSQEWKAFFCVDWVLSAGQQDHIRLPKYEMWNWHWHWAENDLEMTSFTSFLIDFTVTIDVPQHFKFYLDEKTLYKVQ